jgi:hypothetical protein
MTQMKGKAYGSTLTNKLRTNLRHVNNAKDRTKARRDPKRRFKKRKRNK